LGPILYFNGEMAPDTLRGYLHQALSGLGKTAADLLSGRFMFEGDSGYSSLALAHDNPPGLRFEALLARLRPSVVVLDTLRGLTHLDENDTRAVRELLNWLEKLAVKYGCCIVVLHHLRKLGPVSNSDRERVAGSRDLIAAADVHLAFKSTDGRPMHGLTLGKTRFPADGIGQGTHWPVEARLDMAVTPPRSTFTIGEPDSATMAASIDDDEDEILAAIDAEGPRTIEQLGARTGNRKRAYERLLKGGTIVKRGTVERKSLYGRPAEYDSSGFSFDPAADPTCGKPHNHAGLNGVSPRPHSRPQGFPGSATAPATPGAGSVAEPADPVSLNEWGQGSDTIRDPDPDPTRGNVAVASSEPIAPDGFTRSNLPCANGGHVGRLHATDAVCKDCDPKPAVPA